LKDRHRLVWRPVQACARAHHSRFAGQTRRASGAVPKSAGVDRREDTRILYEIERCDLDVRVENLRRVRTSLQTMPRVRSEMVDRTGSLVGRPPGKPLSSSCQHLEKSLSRRMLLRRFTDKV